MKQAVFVGVRLFELALNSERTPLQVNRLVFTERGVTHVEDGKFEQPRRAGGDCVPIQPNRRRSQQPIKRQQGAFIRGPIPLAWLDIVLGIPGRSPLVVALALVYQSGLERTGTVRFTRKLMARFGIPLRTCHDVLAKMEAAGLVAVTKRAGRCREVKILNRISDCSDVTCDD